jgi:hypothetical protein
VIPADRRACAQRCRHQDPSGSKPSATQINRISDQQTITKNIVLLLLLTWHSIRAINLYLNAAVPDDICSHAEPWRWFREAGGASVQAFHFTTGCFFSPANAAQYFHDACLLQIRLSAVLKRPAHFSVNLTNDNQLSCCVAPLHCRLPQEINHNTL